MWEWATYLRIRPVPSWGEWADGVDLGRDSSTTLYSLRMGSIAYRGGVPPAALLSFEL